MAITDSRLDNSAYPARFSQDIMCFRIEGFGEIRREAFSYFKKSADE